MDNPAQDDVWGWWQTACEHPNWIGTEKLPIHESHPQTGFYRVRRKDSDWEPVQLWCDETGDWQATRCGKPVDPVRIDDLWIWCCRQPVSEEAFDRASAGDGWADEPERAPGIGHNLDADPFDALRIEWLGEKEAAEKLLKAPIADQASADRAAILARRLKDIANKADNLHGIEKAPVLIEYRRVDDKWRELREAPAGLSRTLKKHQTAWLQEQDRFERQRVAAAEAEAERLRREAAEAAKKAATPDQEAEAGAKVSAAQEAAREAEYRRPQAGRTNARTSLRTYRVGRIVDFDAFLAAIKNSQEIKEAARRVCQRMATANVPCAGMEIDEEKRVV